MEKLMHPISQTDVEKALNTPIETPIENVKGSGAIKKVHDNIGMGCLVEMPARLKHDIYIEKFFQANHLFQANNYADYFTSSMVDDFLKSVSKQKDTNYIILSYKPYSKLLTEKVKNHLQGNKYSVKYVITGTDDDESNTIQFDFHGRFKSSKYDVITIIPIATTLVTLDNLISDFKSSYKDSKCDFNFIYNHCSILIRDENKVDDNGITELEKEFGWKKADERNRTIILNTFTCTNKTLEQDPLLIHYSISKEITWYRLIDETVFPSNYWEERFILETKNSSLNISNLLGYPQMSIPSDNKEDNINNKRLKEMSEYIYYGHIHHYGKHFRYYFDILGYIKTYSEHKNSELKTWVVRILNKYKNWAKSTNIIVTPEPEQTPYLSSFINKHLFGERAHIIFLDKQDRNFEYKYSHLRQMSKGKDVKYFFVDPALLTGNSYYTAKSQMSAILDVPQFKFNNIITVINRLSKTKYQEIEDDLKNKKIYTFVYFFIPPCKTENTGCYLCNLTTSYEKLKNNSVITDCRNIIESNRLRYNVINYQNLTKDEDSNTINDKDRVLNRIKWVNRIFYEISSINSEKKISIEEKERQINEKLDVLLKGTEENVDDKISFIKAISFPPLSDYARIRKYAFERLLKELHKVLGKSNPQIRDLILLKVLLKRLAMLGSNALVRKNVIIESWQLYTKVRKQLPDEIKKLKEDNGKDKERLLHDILEYLCCEENNIFVDDELSNNIINNKDNKLNAFPKQLLFYVKIATHNDPSKSLWLGELLRTGKEINVEKYNYNFSASKTHMFNDLFNKKSPLIDDKYLLHYLFYENTTIIRKTIDCFEKENTSLKAIFKDGGKLNDIKGKIWDVKNNIIAEYKELSNKKYYYNWFRVFFPIIDRENYINQDRSVEELRLIEKYFHILYARLLLKRLLEPSTNGEKDSFDKVADHLLEVFSLIMDAQAAYISICPQSGAQQTYILSTFCCSDEYKIDKEKLEDYNHTFYGKKLLSKEDPVNCGHSFVMRDISGKIEAEIPYGENFNDMYSRAAYLTLNLRKPKIDSGIVTDNIIGLVTFLYTKEKQKEISYRRFMKEKQEQGRLLLLLKPEIDRYVEHLEKEKQFEIWKEKVKTDKILRKINYKSGHRFQNINSIFDRIADDNESIGKLYEEFYTLSNVVISFIFSLIVDTSTQELNFGGLDYKLSQIFDGRFASILHGLNWGRWRFRWDGVIDIRYDNTITVNKFVFQSFIIQCFNNAHLHCSGEESTLKISFQRDRMIIINTINNPIAKGDIDAFNKKYKRETIDNQISSNKAVDYGLTLISFIKYCESVDLKCVPEYKTIDDINYFYVTIFFY